MPIRCSLNFLFNILYFKAINSSFLCFCLVCRLLISSIYRTPEKTTGDCLNFTKRKCSPLTDYHENSNKDEVGAQIWLTKTHNVETFHRGLLRGANCSEHEDWVQKPVPNTCKVIGFFLSFDPLRWISLWGVITCYDCTFLVKHQDKLLQWQYAVPWK